MNRTRTHPAIVSYGLYLYYSSRSFRLAAKCLSSFMVKRGHVAYGSGFRQRYAFLADRFRIIDRSKITQVFVDETLVKIYWLWIAYEPNMDICLMMMHLSRERTTMLVCYRFFKQLKDRYGRKPIFTDRWCLWYNNTACKWLRLPHRIYGIGLKNIMERFIQHIKDRTECFDDHFPCRKPDCDKQHIWNWLKLFVLYIHMDMDNRIRFMIFLVMDGG